MKRLKNQKGQITVFLSLMFLVMSFAFLCILDGIQIYLNKGLVQDAFYSAGKVVTANYNLALYSRYHLFFLDEREKTFIASDGLDYMKSYCKQNRGLSCTQVNVVEEKGILEENCNGLKAQIKEYVVYQKLEEEKQKVLELTDYQEETEQKAKEQLEEMEQLDEGLTISDQEPETDIEKEEEMETSEEMVDEEKQADNMNWKGLKELLKSIFHSGILLYVADERAISGLKVNLMDIPSGEYRADEKETNLKLSFDNIRELVKLLESQKEDMPLDFENLQSNLSILAYIDKNFRTWKDISWKQDTALHYEIEYMIVGKDKDQDNLKSIAERIFLSRFVTNYGYLLTDMEIVSRADEIALAVSSVFGVPEVQAAVKQILLAALSCGESLLDVHTLFSGEKVPFVKSKNTWTISFENAVTVLKEKKQVLAGNKSISYQDYLKLFLLLEFRKNQKELRMADVMQWNVRLDQADFELRQCLASYSWEADFICQYQYPNPLGDRKEFTLLQEVTY